MTTRLHEIMTGLLAAGAFDDLDIPTSPFGYHELSKRTGLAPVWA